MKLLRSFIVTLVLFLLIATQKQAILDAQASLRYGFNNLQQNVLLQNADYSPFNAQGNSLTPEAAAAINKVAPGVVSIYGSSDASGTRTGSARTNRSLFGFLGSAMSPHEDISTIKISAGTGFFIDPDGYILTNNHVVSDVNSAYSVMLDGGKRKNAEVVYRDPKSDLAVLKISGNNYPVLALGDSSDLKVGTPVLGLGNAFGKFTDTLSSGKITSLKRTIIAGNDDLQQRLTGVIQTSAQLYPGDSGGPLFDLSGNVVGINVAVATDRDNVSFSIPINSAKDVIGQYAK